MADVVTELTIDARGAEQGSATYVRAMQAAQSAANRVIDAQNAVAAAQDKQTATMTSGAQSIGRVTAAYDKFRASLNPIAQAQVAANQAMNKAILTTDNAVKAGVITQETAAAQIAELQEKQIAGIHAVIAATEEETGAAKIAEGAIESLKGFATGLLAGLGAGVLFSEISELPSKIMEAVHSAAEIQHVAEATGLAASQVQELDYAGEQFGHTADNMNTSLERFVKNMGNTASGSSQLGKLLKANGIVPTGNTMTDIDHFADLVEKASSAEQRGNLVAQAFGKGNADLVNLFAKGSAGLKDFAAQADASGAVLDKGMLETAMSLDAEFQQLKASSSTAFKEFAISIAPAVLLVMRAVGAVIGFVAGNFGVLSKAVLIGGAALAGYFGPAMLAGLATLFTTIIDGLHAIALAVLANPLGLLIAAIAAVIVAVFLFRDKIKQVFGVDIVGDMQAAGNFVIGTFVGAFNSIKDTWSELPAAISDILAQTEQSALDGVVYMVRQMLVELNIGISSVDGLLNKLKLPQLDRIDLPRYLKVSNPSAGAANAVGSTVSRDMSAAYGPDYIGQALGAVGGALSGGLSGVAGDGAYGSGTNGTGPGGKVTSFDKAMQSAKADTAALVAQQQALGQTAQQADYLEEQTKLLNEATSKGVALSGKQITAIDAAADAYAKQKARLAALTEVYNDGKQAVGDLLGTLRTDLVQGTSLWGSLGDAASKALDDIASKATQMAADGIWNSIFGAVTGGLGGGSGGGILSSILGIFGIGGRSASSGLAESLGTGSSYATGGYTGPGGMSAPAGIVHRGEYVFDAASTARIGVSTLNAMRGMPGYATGGVVGPMAANLNLPRVANSNVSNASSMANIAYSPTYNISGLSKEDALALMAAHDQTFLKSLHARFPTAVQDVVKNPNSRGKSYFAAAS